MDIICKIWALIGNNSAEIIAISALAFTVLEHRRNKRIDLLATMPLIQVHFNENTDDPVYNFVGIEIENVGFGNAFLLPAYFLLSGKECGSNEKGKTASLAQSFPSIVNFMAVHNVSIIRPGEKRKLLWVEPKKYDTDEMKVFLSQLKTLDVHLIYASAFGRTSISLLRGYDDPNIDKKIKKLRKKYKVPKRIYLDNG